MFGVTEAFAMGGQPADGSQPGFLMQIFPLLLMVVVVYLLIFRPQIKKAEGATGDDRRAAEGR